MEATPRKSQRAALWSALLLFLPIAASCAGHWTPQPEIPQSYQRNSTLEVYNNHPENIRVYVLVGGTQILLGTVESFTARTLEIPPTASTSPVPILIQAFASRATFKTHEVDFVGLPALEMRVGANLKMTTVTVRR